MGTAARPHPWSSRHPRRGVVCSARHRSRSIHVPCREPVLRMFMGGSVPASRRAVGVFRAARAPSARRPPDLFPRSVRTARGRREPCFLAEAVRRIPRGTMKSSGNLAHFMIVMTGYCGSLRAAPRVATVDSPCPVGSGEPSPLAARSYRPPPESVCQNLGTGNRGVPAGVDPGWGDRGWRRGRRPVPGHRKAARTNVTHSLTDACGRSVGRPMRRETVFGMWSQDAPPPLCPAGCRGSRPRHAGGARRRHGQVPMT